MVASHDFAAEFGEGCAAALAAAGLGFDEGRAKEPVEVVDQRPGAVVGSARPRRGIAPRALPLAVVANVSAASPTTYLVHADHLDRPVRMTDASKTLVWDAIYKPFGEVQSITGPASLDARFPGQWFQLETGLNHSWHRTYDPSTGRYFQPDPLGFVDGPSVYAYAANSPLMWTEREGLAGDGTPSNNRAQNRQFNAVCKTLGLDKKQRRLLHEGISKENYGYKEILQIGREMFDR